MIAGHLPRCEPRVPGFSMTALPTGTEPSHDATSARDVAAANHVGPERITAVVAAIVADPIGIKLGLPTTPRVMWVIYGDNTHRGGPADAGVGPGPYPAPGTVTHSLTLVDDATLKLAGNFLC